MVGDVEMADDSKADKGDVEPLRLGKARASSGDGMDLDTQCALVAAQYSTAGNGADKKMQPYLACKHLDI